MLLLIEAFFSRVIKAVKTNQAVTWGPGSGLQRFLVSEPEGDGGVDDGNLLVVVMASEIALYIHSPHWLDVR